MKKKRIIFAAGAVVLLFAVTSTKPVDSQNYPNITVKTKRVNKYKDKIEDYESDNLTLKAETDLIKDKTEESKEKLAKKPGSKTSQTTSTKETASAKSKQTDLASLTYSGQLSTEVNNNQPDFSQSDLSTSRGAWQTYGNLDSLNRATTANAMLNQSLMPTAKREPLHWDPTGWHNKRISSGWLYNRSHLIGYQLTGQNNNPKNLITGTEEMNVSGMLPYENEVADYLKESSNNYVRYRVKPIFKGDELLARGVQMEAKSVGSNAVSFNVYVFNVQPGVVLNYSDGTSRVQN
ncbi:DNA/RNA non-specific endonuclease [Lactobacillus delbrueckii subsp. bulgaricus]|uniref:DNA/RNA non-specific endonuclease n=1 Tax=Lactobacillus delbrueckii TaxID=1584 RepID=UPI001C1E6BFB|nr:DNA/RNA non-specific endonuclease [Lactobacillus delbrueckii]MBU6049967.1 DNA/RNA non-specific endonuclease [Lactobacillus delbrueckii]MCD5462704.1 DNA/RNA non-specific endonuclease [Lactobacillus delbrueckii subsp. bulgaricus]MCD5478289.1 DNA/RNA non-specific endonuclease [Lactobacillus delbrueckii subsp. bulgaricus]MCT3478533.1 hydroxyacid dehydrogenase [Lactobacillus delbrueckii subsp. bulgaricus]MCT3480179.1 hydroxyacid dehydrogenase [Lactobacillus delbrueckii subsp. bulgaricus]